MDIGKILRQLCEMKKVEMHLEAETCPDLLGEIFVGIGDMNQAKEYTGKAKELLKKVSDVL